MLKVALSTYRSFQCKKLPSRNSNMSAFVLNIRTALTCTIFNKPDQPSSDYKNASSFNKGNSFALLNRSNFFLPEGTKSSRPTTVRLRKTFVMNIRFVGLIFICIRCIANFNIVRKNIFYKKKLVLHVICY